MFHIFLFVNQLHERLKQNNTKDLLVRLSVLSDFPVLSVALNPEPIDSWKSL